MLPLRRRPKRTLCRRRAGQIYCGRNADDVCTRLKNRGAPKCSCAEQGLRSLVGAQRSSSGSGLVRRGVWSLCASRARAVELFLSAELLHGADDASSSANFLGATKETTAAGRRGRLV